MVYKPGTYQVISDVYIRKEPRITLYNYAGKKTVGTQVEVYDVQTNKDNSTWGRISEPDAAGVSLWCCIENSNRKYMKMIEDAPAQGDIEKRLNSLIEWAKTVGYKGE